LWVDAQRGEDAALGGREFGALPERAGGAFEGADVEVLRVLADAVPGVAGGGREVFPELFERSCGPVAGPAGMAAPAGPLVDLPDSAENAAEFGYAGSRDNRSAFPKARVVALAECGAHAFVVAEVGAYAVGEKALAQRLYPRWRGDELLTADRGFHSWDAWGTAQAIGAALLWRAPTQLELPVLRVLGDGIYLTVLIKPSVRGGAGNGCWAPPATGRGLTGINTVPDAFDERGLLVVHLVWGHRVRCRGPGG